MTTTTDRPTDQTANDNTQTPGDQVLGAIGGAIFVLAALAWMAHMLAALVVR